MYYQDIKIELVKVDSSNVAGIGYHDEFQIMSVEMLNGIIYYYLDIPKKHFTEMTKQNKGRWNIKSIGSYLHRNVKGNYRYIRIK